MTVWLIHCFWSLNHLKNELILDEVVSSAKDNNVNVILNISTKKSEFEEIIEISQIYEQVYFSLGIHPHEAHEMCNEIAEFIYNNKSDKYLTTSNRLQQNTDMDTCMSYQSLISKLMKELNHIEHYYLQL